MYEHLTNSTCQTLKFHKGFWVLMKVEKDFVHTSLQVISLPPCAAESIKDCFEVEASVVHCGAHSADWKRNTNDKFYYDWLWWWTLTSCWSKCDGNQCKLIRSKKVRTHLFVWTLVDMVLHFFRKYIFFKEMLSWLVKLVTQLLYTIHIERTRTDIA